MSGKTLYQTVMNLGWMGVIMLAPVLVTVCTVAEALTIDVDNPSISSQLSESVVDPSLERRQHLQRLFNAAVLDKTVHYKHDEILVRWPQEMTISGQIVLRIQKPDGRIYSERFTQIEGGSVINLGKAYVLRDGHYQVVLMPPLGEYYMGGMRIDRRLDIEIRVQQP